MSAQIIKQDGKAAFAVVPIDEYNKLLADAEMLGDVKDFDRATAELASGEDETIPADISKRLVLGDESPLKVWREYRRMTQTQLADQAGVSQSQVALIEGGKRQGTVDVLKSLAGVLNVDLDDLVN